MIGYKIGPDEAKYPVAYLKAFVTGKLQLGYFVDFFIHLLNTPYEKDHVHINFIFTSLNFIIIILASY